MKKELRSHIDDLIPIVFGALICIPVAIILHPLGIDFYSIVAQLSAHFGLPFTLSTITVLFIIFWGSFTKFLASLTKHRRTTRRLKKTNFTNITWLFFYLATYLLDFHRK
jgi:Na+/phosphate symporter